MSLQSECVEVCKLDVECGSLVIFATMTMVQSEKGLFYHYSYNKEVKYEDKTLQYLAVDG